MSPALHPWDRYDQPDRHSPRAAGEVPNCRPARSFIGEYVLFAAAMLAVAFVAFTILWFAVSLLGG
jgi:hypothetical protein